MAQGGSGASSKSRTGRGGAAPARVARDAERARSTRAAERPNADDEARGRLAASSKLYYRIGEVSELTGVKAHVLRYWETEFRWMTPPKSRSKQRLYRKRDIELVWLLKKLLWDQRYTIAGARQRIAELGLDEALARSAGSESLDAALRASLEGALAAIPAVEGAPLAAADADPSSTERSESAAVRGDRLGLRAALDHMRGELLALRSVLEQGA